MERARMKLLLTCAVTFCSLAGFAQQPSTSPQSSTPQAESATTIATTTQPATQPEKAKVYFYRYKQYAGSALSPSVYCDEVELARMENGRYFTVKLDPGKHTFRSNDKQSGSELDVKAGQQYFLRVEIAAGMMKGHGRLILTDPEQGRYEVNSSKMKPLDLKKVV